MTKKQADLTMADTAPTAESSVGAQQISFHPLPEGWEGPDFAGDFHTLALPTTTIARIDATPRLAPIVQQWHWIDHGPELVMERVNHMAQLIYSERGRNDRSSKLNYFSNTLLARYDFPAPLMGGLLESQCVIHWRDPRTGQTGLSRMGTSQNAVLGDNPSKADIRAALGSIEMQVIAYKESRLRQFDNAGLPLWGPPNGFGVMQLDTPKPTASQLWNWRENVQGGVALLVTKKAEVQQHFKNLYAKFPQAPKLTSAQLKLSEYQYYNGGWYWDWDDQSSAWGTVGVTSYGDDAVRLEDLVLAGKPPGDW